MSRKNYQIPTPNLIAETVMCCFKIFLAIFIVTNFVWGVIYFKPSTPRTGNTHVEINQNGNRDIVNKDFK